MGAMELVIGNKRYSSWSLRGWLVARLSGLPFRETMIPLDQPQTVAAIAARSPSGMVPALIDGPVTVWDSLAIAEYLHEKAPGAGMWPADPVARAHARSVSAETHSGFLALRKAMPMHLGRAPAPLAEAPGPDVVVAIDRIVAIWRSAHTRFADGQPFLYGGYTTADAFFAPIATRFHTYAVALPDDAAAYVAALMAWPAMVEWIAGAAAETIDVPRIDKLNL